MFWYQFSTFWRTSAVLSVGSMSFTKEFPVLWSTRATGEEMLWRICWISVLKVTSIFGLKDTYDGCDQSPIFENKFYRENWVLTEFHRFSSDFRFLLSIKTRQDNKIHWLTPQFFVRMSLSCLFQHLQGSPTKVEQLTILPSRYLKVTQSPSNENWHK